MPTSWKVFQPCWYRPDLIWSNDSRKITKSWNFFYFCHFGSLFPHLDPIRTQLKICVFSIASWPAVSERYLLNIWQKCQRLLHLIFRVRTIWAELLPCVNSPHWNPSLPLENPGMRLTTRLPFSANIHANQETKDNISCTPNTPRSRIRCQLPDVWEEQSHQRGEMKRSWQEKKTKLKRILLWGRRLSLTFFHHSWLRVLLWETRGSEGGRFPGPSQHQLHICSLVADTLTTLSDPWMKTLISVLSYSSFLLAANRLHMGH